MALYKFSYHQTNPKVPLSSLKRTWSCRSMDEAIKTAQIVNSAITDGYVYRIEDIKSGETSYL